jgi:beta-lactamase class C
MKTTCYLLSWLLFCGCLISGCTESSSSTRAGFFPLHFFPQKSPLDTALQAFVDDYDRYFADSLALTGTPGAALVIVKDSMVIFTKGYGKRAAGKGDKVNENTVFRIGSLSKGFAGVLTAILVKKGYLNWNDPVQQHFPEFSLKDKKQAERVQIRHLLSHTTGLPYHAFGNLIEEGYDQHTIYRQYFASAKLFGKEGGFFGYQNTAFCVIEPVLQAVTAKTYPELLKEYIFQPAGLQTASCDYESMKASRNKALPHSIDAAGWAAVDTVSTNYYGFAAAGGINASIADMGEWLLLLLGRKPGIIDDATLDEVFAPVIKTGKERRILPGWIDRDSAAYAMGWRILEKDGETLVYHSGFVNNYHSEIAFNRQEKLGICVLFNANTLLKGNCIRAFFERWKKSKQKGQPLPGDPVLEVQPAAPQ